MKKLLAFLGSLILTALLAISLHAQITDVITVSGNWPAPVGVIQVTVEAWGAGGGGGATPGWWHTAGGGGGGAYAKIENFTVVGGNNYAVQIGAGGSGAYPTETAGGDSWFVDASTCMAKGGGHGDQGPEHDLGDLGNYFDGIAGTGGSAGSSVGTTTYSGGNGHTGVWILTSGYGGGGGSAAGTGANGLNATGQSGANSPLPNPTGDGGPGHDFNGAGSPGIAPGGGGGGSRGGSGASSSAPGGDGARGEVRISYFWSTDLAITKTVSPGPYVYGNNVVFTITVTNNGPANATNISVLDILPDGYAYVTHTASLGGYTPGTGIWLVGNLNSAASATLTITATILGPGVYTYENIAVITGQGANELDPNAQNNEAFVIIEPGISASVPISNWALYLGIGLIVAFTVIRLRRVL